MSLPRARDRHRWRPSPASDQFACGSVLWEALVGCKLFEGETDYETYCRLRDCIVQPLRPRRSDVPPGRADHQPRAVRRRRQPVPVDPGDGAPDRHGAQERQDCARISTTVLSKTVIEARSVMGLGAGPGRGIRAHAARELLPDEPSGWCHRARGRRRPGARAAARPDPLPAVLRQEALNVGSSLLGQHALAGLVRVAVVSVPAGCRCRRPATRRPPCATGCGSGCRLVPPQLGAGRCPN